MAITPKGTVSSSLAVALFSHSKRPGSVNKLGKELSIVLEPLDEAAEFKLAETMMS